MVFRATTLNLNLWWHANLRGSRYQALTSPYYEENIKKLVSFDIDLFPIVVESRFLYNNSCGAKKRISSCLYVATANTRFLSPQHFSSKNQQCCDLNCESKGGSVVMVCTEVIWMDRTSINKDNGNRQRFGKQSNHLFITWFQQVLCIWGSISQAWQNPFTSHLKGYAIWACWQTPRRCIRDQRWYWFLETKHQ